MRRAVHVGPSGGSRVMLALLLGVTVTGCTGWRHDGSRRERDVRRASSSVRSAPSSPEGGSSADARRIVSIALGEFHTCVLLGSGEVRCWGKRDMQDPPVDLGNAATAAAAVSEKLGAKALRISAGGDQ